MTTSQTTAAVSNPRPSSQWLITLVGVALLIIGCFLSWSYVPALLGNLSVNFFPGAIQIFMICLLYTSPSPRDRTRSRMPSSA